MRRIAIAAALLATGCSTQHPQNAEEFRKAAAGGFMMSSETVELNRPLAQVAATWQRRAPECLNVSIRTTSQTSTSYQVITSTYRSTVVAGKERAELQLQRELKGGGLIMVGTPPEGGDYILVFDAYPLPGNRTKLQWLGLQKGHETVVRAVKSWASGENLGCPDFTKG